MSNVYTRNGCPSEYRFDKIESGASRHHPFTCAICLKRLPLFHGRLRSVDGSHTIRACGVCVPEIVEGWDALRASTSTKAAKPEAPATAVWLNPSENHDHGGAFADTTCGDQTPVHNQCPSYPHMRASFKKNRTRKTWVFVIIGRTGDGDYAVTRLVKTRTRYGNLQVSVLDAKRFDVRADAVRAYDDLCRKQHASRDYRFSKTSAFNQALRTNNDA